MTKLADQPFDTLTLKQKALDHLWMPYTQWTELKAQGGPTVMVEAEGVYIFDSEGKRYLDGISALEASIVGHRNRELIGTCREQMTRAGHEALAGRRQRHGRAEREDSEGA
jgi:adenosylmethionine-8-amino-7-oxononanoate aminotransferase